MNEIDAQTLRGCKRGDPQALGALYDCYRQPVYYTVRRMVGEQDAEDVTQDVFIAAFRAIGKFKGQSKLSTWIISVATNVCLMHLRKRRSKQGRTDSLEETEYDPPVTTLSPSQEVANKEFWENLSKAIDELPDHHRAVITLRSFEDLSYEQIAKAMKVGIEEVRATLFRARRRLIEKLRKD
jgi:RNA polymerase sigma-70 factor (ECF subfamily)